MIKLYEVTVNSFWLYLDHIKASFKIIYIIFAVVYYGYLNLLVVYYHIANYNVNPMGVNFVVYLFQCKMRTQDKTLLNLLSGCYYNFKLK
jgi:hypothetical protein